MNDNFSFLGAYPSPIRGDELCAFLRDLKGDTLDALVDWFVPDSTERANSLDTGIHIEAFLIKNSVKDKQRTSLGPADV